MASLPGPRTADEYNEMAEGCGHNQYELYDRLHARYGDVMYQSEQEFGVDIVTLFHPTDIEAVIRREGPLPRGLGQALLPFTRFYAQHAPNGLNLGRIDGPDWKRVRRPMAKHMMPPRAAKAYLPNIARVLGASSAGLPRHAARLGDYMPKVTFEMICSILLDVRPGIVSGTASARDEAFVATARRVFPLMAALMAPSEMPKPVEILRNTFPDRTRCIALHSYGPDFQILIPSESSAIL